MSSVQIANSTVRSKSPAMSTDQTATLTVQPEPATISSDRITDATLDRAGATQPPLTCASTECQSKTGITKISKDEPVSVISAQSVSKVGKIGKIITFGFMHPSCAVNDVDAHEAGTSSLRSDGKRLGEVRLSRSLIWVHDGTTLVIDDPLSVTSRSRRTIKRVTLERRYYVL